MVKFADEALIEVSSGKGGNGCIAFRREKYIPHGGPSGGDGGRGGDLIFEVRRNLRTLVHLRHRQKFKGKTGGDGQGKKCHGKDGEDCVIFLPPGTLIRDAETGELIHDFGLEDSGRFVFLKGGNGGWGNVHFKGSTNQAPRTALPGQPGESRLVKVELNIIADIGFVGFPNAGKSSLLDFFTNARPKIAPYPFTTKIPNLGVLRVDEEQDIILADIPGIIEGASDGLGLGFRFLKHISRSAGLAFLIDLDSEDYLDSYEKLTAELENFSEELVSKDRVIIANKLDVPEGRERFAALVERYPDFKIFGISVHNRWGLDEVREEFIRMVNGKAEELAAEAEKAAMEYAGIPHFMTVEPDEPENPTESPTESEDSDSFGATVSLNRKRRGKRK
ncbi:GTPase ObgE [Treponema zuelzerae]|uniref:GTPase Obg n=1 Tax=Teretinema zuelzerae TaxID=156 RepID=A0AAE3EJZ4_9SPIR|nr:GTPase ObgE [Teretinema zuelzerae]MCD1655221.1 GTPase ObgE [Teretinema zuelzerae]